MDSYDQNPEKKIITQDNCKVLTGFTYENLLGLTGILGYTDYASLLGSIEISITKSVVRFILNNRWIIMRRDIDLEDNEIWNDHLVLDPTRTGAGLAILVSQIFNATQAGFEKIHMKAFSSGNQKEYVGYIIWAKLGFTMNTDSSSWFNEEFLPENSLSAMTLHDLLKTKEGEQLWSDKGNSWIGEFLLREHSVNREILLNYIDGKIQQLENEIQIIISDDDEPEQGCTNLLINLMREKKQLLKHRQLLFEFP